MKNIMGNVLIIAGSDSGGGAGIQADIKTVTCLGGYAMTAITALTAQNTLGVDGIFEIPTAFIKKQLEAVHNDIQIDAVKIGMLGNSDIIKTVSEFIKSNLQNIPIVLDPVMIAKGGSPLLEQSANQTLINELLPLASIVTPNIPEAETIIGKEIKNSDEMKSAALQITNMGANSALVKGGHLSSLNNSVIDVLAYNNEIFEFEKPRIDSNNTHGTGCTLASAIATGLAQKMDMHKSTARAKEYVFQAIKHAPPNIGHGHGPLNHSYRI
jgi:hydroxymethylpyrimidine/phosphomethylpyrimidine kinase